MVEMVEMVEMVGMVEAVEVVEVVDDGGGMGEGEKERDGKQEGG